MSEDELHAERWARIKDAQTRLAEREHEFEQLLAQTAETSTEQLVLPSAQVIASGDGAALSALQAENVDLRRRLRDLEVRQGHAEESLVRDGDFHYEDVSLRHSRECETLSKQLRGALARLEMSTHRERQWQRIFVNIGSLP
mmetsp:Transcript_7143/g.21794  ORF Transcript_7143/g.21794 Transcript_7143/m.21794 type:complete len:142 (+) Transcript_7143:36-461(+)